MMSSVWKGGKNPPLISVKKEMNVDGRWVWVKGAICAQINDQSTAKRSKLVDEKCSLPLSCMHDDARDVEHTQIPSKIISTPLVGEKLSSFRAFIKASLVDAFSAAASSRGVMVTARQKSDNHHVWISAWQRE